MKFYLCLFVLIFGINAAEQNNNNFLTQEQIAIGFTLFKFSKCLWSANLTYIPITAAQAKKIKNPHIENLRDITKKFQNELGAKQSNIFQENILRELKLDENSVTSICPILYIASFLIERQNYMIGYCYEKIMGPKLYYLAYVKTIPDWINNLTQDQKNCIIMLNKQVKENKELSDLESKTMFRVLKAQFIEEDFQRINLAYGLNYKKPVTDYCVIS